MKENNWTKDYKKKLKDQKEKSKKFAQKFKYVNSGCVNPECKGHTPYQLHGEIESIKRTAYTSDVNINLINKQLEKRHWIRNIIFSIILGIILGLILTL